MKGFFSKKVILALTLLTLVSYGQLVKMNFWQDDNAVVFKFTHINEHAGYLGRGIFGEGAYKYTITPYLPIFYVFGYNPIPYFFVTLVFVIFSTYAVYFFFKVLLEDTQKAAFAGLLYASGYVASDGFIRMFNSVLSSITIILTCAVIGFYYIYVKNRQFFYYFASLLFCLLALEIGFIRTHYLVFVIIVFELIYNFDGLKNFKGVLYRLFTFLLRITPFAYLFYHYYILADDSRSGQVNLLIKSLLKGEFYNTYSFFGSLGNILLSNEFFFEMYRLTQDKFQSPLTETRIVFGLITVLLIITVYFLYQRFISVWFAAAHLVVSASILILARQNFAYSGLVGGFNEKISAYFGVFFILLGFLLFKILPNKKLSLILGVWAALNLAAYAAYIPIYTYPSDNRYLLHSFIPIIGILLLWAYGFREKLPESKISYIPFLLIFIWGGVNLFSGLSLQNKIITHRSEPSKRFFKQLINYYPKIEKNSIFYFYIPDKLFAQAHYNAGFGVAQMPEETAIAWRYGIDRYDLVIVNSFEDLKKKVAKDNIPVDKTYAFIADPNDLINVTNPTRNLLQEGAYYSQDLDLSIETKRENDKKGTKLTMEPVIINSPANIPTLIPLDITIHLKARPLDSSDLVFPIRVQNSTGSISEADVRKHYLDYNNRRDDYYKTASISATTIWKDFEVQNLLDKDPSTYWEADRIAWDDHNQGFTIDLKKEMHVGGIIYRNGPSSLTPTEFEIQVSTDNQNFIKVKDIVVDVRKRDDVQKITFDSVNTRYIRLLFHKTQFDDSPGISEIEVLPEEFRDIDSVVGERFYRFAFSNVESALEWKDLVDNFKSRGLVKISWKTDGADNVMSSVYSTVPVNYNGVEQKIKIQIPAGGQNLNYLEVMPLTIPGELVIPKIIYENKPIYDDQ